MKNFPALWTFVMPAILVSLLSGLAACSSTQNHNPVAASEKNDDAPKEDSVALVAEKPNRYTTKRGDTLKKIAGRPEIYGDPNLWPILKDANVGKISYGKATSKGVQLEIPRDLTAGQIEMALARARQVADAEKASQAAWKKREADRARPTPEIKADLSAAPLETQASAQPAQGGVLLPVLIGLLVILIVLAGIKYFFMKKENRSDVPDPK